MRGQGLPLLLGEPGGLGVRTVLVRGGHLGPDVKQLQQGVILDHLVVPAATLDSELHPCNKDK